MSSTMKFVCGEGVDCPCQTAENTRPVPNPTKTAPDKVTLKPGEAKYTCTCGQSKNFPFCDGSHKAYNEEHGTSLAPIPVKNETDADKDYYLCTCGHSKNRPFCDGSHKSVHAVAV